MRRTAQSGVLHTYGAYVLALYLLATTRWGSYILPGPPYVADLIIGLLVIERLFALPLSGRVLSPINGALAAALTALLGVALVEFLVGAHSTDAVRDAAPYFYAILVFLSPPLFGRNASVAVQLLTGCLYAHLIWTSATLALPAIGAHFATPGNPSVFFLSLRSDVDGLINGLAASVGLYRMLTKGRGTLLFAWGVVLVMISHSRSSLLATILLLAATIGYVLAQRRRGYAPDDLPLIGGRLGYAAGNVGSSSTIARAGVAILAVAVAVFMFSPTAIERLSGTFGGEQTSALGRQAEGTTHAREDAWGRLENWILSSEKRAFVGTGFGLNVMIASGASIALVHRDDPSLRAPHNFLLSIWAHLGIIGVCIYLGLAAIGLRLAVSIRRIPMNDVDMLACLIVIGMPLVALVGVVMESPFGAIPYFWALGQLGTRIELARRLRWI